MQLPAYWPVLARTENPVSLIAAGFFEFGGPPLCRYAVAVLITAGRWLSRIAAHSLSVLSIPVAVALLLLVFASRVLQRLSQTPDNVDE